MFRRFGLTLATCLSIAACAQATTIVNYGVDGGGNNMAPLGGLTARATFSASTDQLAILLENTSTGLPAAFEVGDSLLVSLGLNLPAGIDIASGNAAVIGPGSHGLGSWSGWTPGTSVAAQWLWTNDFGGDLMNFGEPLACRQVISTSEGQGSGSTTLFGGGSGNVDGPFGGMTADPPLLSVPSSKPAVCDSILFTLTLSSSLTEMTLGDVAQNSVIEFGSDARYLLVPEPAGVLSALFAMTLFRRRR